MLSDQINSITCVLPSSLQVAKVYRSKIMLYVPWRPDESSDLLGGYMDFHSHYEDKKDNILENEQKFTQNATEIDEAIDDLTEHGLAPQHAYRTK